MMRLGLLMMVAACFVGSACGAVVSVRPELPAAAQPPRDCDVLSTTAGGQPNVDPNGEPLNPFWGTQSSGRSQLPPQATACGATAVAPFSSPYTSQSPEMDEADGANELICALEPGASHGYANWAPASLTGYATWDIWHSGDAEINFYFIDDRTSGPTPVTRSRRLHGS